MDLSITFSIFFLEKIKILVYIVDMKFQDTAFKEG